MKQLFSFLRDRHHIILKFFFFFLAVGLIVFIFPKEGKFKYEFQKGKPWQHADLIAPFDYPIYKSTEEVQEQKERVRQQQKEYFFKSNRVTKDELQHFEETFEDSWSTLQSDLSKKERKRLKDKSFY